MAENIRPLPSGKFQVRMLRDGVSYKDTFDTLKEAKLFRAEIITGKVAKSLKAKRGVPTFNDLWETYQKGDYWRNKKDTTKKRELQLVDFILDKIGSTPINRIKKSTINEYKNTRLEDTYLRKGVATLYSTTQIRLEMCLISAVFSYVLKELSDKYEDWLAINPCFGIAKPISEARIVRIDFTDYVKIITYFENSSDRTAVYLWVMLQIALHTGMRVSEIGRMERKHIVEDHQGWLSIHIPIAKNQEKRYVPVNKRLKRVLLEVREWETTEPDLAPSDCKYIFWSKTKAGLYRPYEPAQYLLKTRNKLGIENPITFHHFRHEYISKLFETTKLSTIMVSRRTGHKNLQVLNSYAHGAKDYYSDIEEE